MKLTKFLKEVKMKITDFVKQQGSFLTAEDVQEVQPCEVVVTGEAELKENKFGNMRLHIPVDMREDSFIFDCSKTNARIIDKQLGDDTSAWIGKKLKLGTYKTRTSDGKMVDAIAVVED